jgi:hypothetical protein
MKEPLITNGEDSDHDHRDQKGCPDPGTPRQEKPATLQAGNRGAAAAEVHRRYRHC